MIVNSPKIAFSAKICVAPTKQLLLTSISIDSTQGPIMGDIDVIGLTAIICLFGLPFVCGLTAILSRAWVKIVCHQREVDLKHHMLASGMSAEEIERVLNAGKGAKQVSPSDVWPEQ
ncbi:MAG: hypothetical protein KDA77_08435 [Planctomycetaceae bacterium]|nr:hypothetical protein [Planctomycetaceae bacterium]